MVKVKLTLEQTMEAQRGRGLEVYFYSFFNLGTRWGWPVPGAPRSKA